MGLNKSQRMQFKALVCLLGGLFIVILIIWRILAAFGDDEKKKLNEPKDLYIPVIGYYENIWIMAVDEGGIFIFSDGEILHLPMSEELMESEDHTMMTTELRDQMADLVLRDGLVTRMKVKKDRITGKVLRADSGEIELEGYGVVPLSAEYKGYKSYGTPEMCTINDLVFGYSFTDYIMENGEIVGFFIDENGKMENIRVLIKASGYEGIYHERLVLTSKSGFHVSYEEDGKEQVQDYKAGEEITFDTSSALLKEGRVTIEADNLVKDEIIISNLSRNQGIPSYRGSLELILGDKGMILVNELPLEEYLYSVVPSEMPSSYPHEALRAQAICARTYAYGLMLHAAYPQFGAHLDDSTSYQVYNNIDEKEQTTLAVKESFGELLYTAEEELAGAFYYSTSCGVGTDSNVWKTTVAPTLTYLKAKFISREGLERPDEDRLESLLTEDGFREFITNSDPGDFEVGESWYRWSYEVKKLDAEHMCEVMQARQKTDSKKVLVYDGKKKEYVEGEVRNFSYVKDIRVEKRNAGGICDELVIETSDGTYKVITEQYIRYVLNDGISVVKRQDGKEVLSPTLIPSAFFSFTVEKDKGVVIGYSLVGGGYGHGVGMSQNGARNMALSGMKAEEILAFFFDDCVIEKLYEE